LVRSGGDKKGGEQRRRGNNFGTAQGKERAPSKQKKRKRDGCEGQKKKRNVEKVAKSLNSSRNEQKTTGGVGRKQKKQEKSWGEERLGVSKCRRGKNECRKRQWRLGKMESVTGGARGWGLGGGDAKKEQKSRKARGAMTRGAPLNLGKLKSKKKERKGG